MKRKLETATFPAKEKKNKPTKKNLEVDKYEVFINIQKKGRLVDNLKLRTKKKDG